MNLDLTNQVILSVIFVLVFGWVALQLDKVSMLLRPLLAPTHPAGRGQSANIVEVPCWVTHLVSKGRGLTVLLLALVYFVPLAEFVRWTLAPWLVDHLS